MKQYEAVILTIQKLGGVATLGEINQEVFKIKECEWKTKTPFASIRRIVQQNSEIYKIKPGLYGLVKLKKENENKGFIQETENNRNSYKVRNFNHSYYQGMILEIGNLKKLDTFAPNQDKNKKFLHKTLGELRSFKEIPKFTYPELVKKCLNIDAIWFNSRKMPDSLFEIEHSTDIYNSLLKFNELQDFYVRMFIVADKCRKKEFEDKLNYRSFEKIYKRVKFLNYDELSKQYEHIVEKSFYNVIL